MKEKRWKKGLRIVAVVVLMLFLVGIVYSSTIKLQSNKKTDPSLKEKPIEKAVRALNARLGLLERDSKIGDSIPSFGGMFIDEANSTLYIYLISQEDETKVQNVLSPYGEKINIEILPGNYTFKELMKWRVELRTVFEKLNMTRLGIDETKNKITIGIEGADELKSEKLNQELQKLNIPQDAVEVIEWERPVLLQSRNDKFNTLIGGIKIQKAWWETCTLGFSATQGSTKGIVTAGHCANLNDEIYQPSWWSGNYIGSVAKDPSGPRWSDALWVPVSRSIVYQIFKDGGPPQYSVDGEVMSWNQRKDENICKGGISTGETCGRITLTCEDAPHPEYGTLYCQYYADFSAASGDSGSPVYQKHGASTQLYGLLWGLSGNIAIYSTIDEIKNDLGSMTTH